MNRENYNIHEAMSLEENKTKRVLIYYAAPKPHMHGYFSSATKQARDLWLERVCNG